MTAAANPSSKTARAEPTVWTRRLRILVGVCSVVFTLGTVLHNFAVVDTAMIEQMMRQAGGDDPAGAAPGFTTGFRLVGCVYIVGNACGVLALWSDAAWLFWVVLLVNATQALGWVMIPPEMWSVAADRYGAVGVVPSAVTDGGAVLLTVALVTALVVFRAPWARRKVIAG